MKTSVYPRYNVDPKLKATTRWLIPYAKAALEDFRAMDAGIFLRAADTYAEQKLYALGKQSNSRYKRQLGVDERAKTSAYAIDWRVRPIVSKFRDTIITKILELGHNIVATPIDGQSKTEVDHYFARLEAKIAMRQQVQVLLEQGQIGEGEARAILLSPELLPSPEEPQDMEELEIARQYGHKHTLSVEAEDAVALGFFEGNITEARKRVLQDLFDHGVAGYKEDIAPDGSTTIRWVAVDALVINACQNGDFSDAVHIGELTRVPLVELSEHFTPEQMETIACQVRGYTALGAGVTTNEFAKEWDGLSAQVLDLEILTWDTEVYKRRLDARGNLRTFREDFRFKDSDRELETPTGKLKKYVSTEKQNLYRIKWVVGTELAYEYGLASNQKRSPNKRRLKNTYFSYHLYAYNFHRMQAQGFMERLMPMIDDYHVITFKIQNLRNRMVPSGWSIDLDAIESVALSKSGEAMNPKELLEFFYQSGVLIYRGSTMDATNPNRKPLEAIVNSIAPELTALYQELSSKVQEMYDVTGSNPVADGSSTPERLLTAGFDTANQASNNALGMLAFADKTLLQSLAKGVVMRKQIAVKKGAIEAMIPALGEDTARYIKISSALALHEWGIMLERRPTLEERQLLLQDLNMKESQGFIQPEDKILVMETQNLKRARRILAHRIRRRQAEAHARELEKITETSKQQQQSAEAAEVIKVKAAKELHALKLEEIDREKSWNYMTEALKLGMKITAEQAAQEVAVVQQIMTQSHERSMVPAGEAGMGTDANGNGVPDAMEEGMMMAMQEGSRGAGETPGVV